MRIGAGTAPAGLTTGVSAPFHPAPTRPAHPLDQWQIRFSVGIACLVIATLAVGLARASRVDSFGVILGVTLLLSLTLRPLAATFLSIIGWALFTGFVTNSYGQLTFRPEDLRALAVLATVAPALACLARLAAPVRKP